MAVADFKNPKLTQDYTTLLQSIRDANDSQAKMHDSTGVVNVPTGTIRWSSANNRDEKFNGISWVAKTSTYAIDVATLGTYAPSQSATNNTVAVRDSSANILATGFSSSSGNNTSAVTFVMTKNGSNFINPSTASQVKTFLNYNLTEIANFTVGHGNGGTLTNYAFGTNALASTTSATGNSAFGHSTLQFATTGANNTGCGYNTLLLNSSGSGNSALGSGTLANNTTGLENTAVGATAAYLATSVSAVAVVGYNSFYNTTSGANSGIGHSSGYSNTSGSGNTALGYQALYSNTVFSNCTGVGVNSAVTASEQVQLGAATTTTYSYGAVQNRSDKRDKANIRDSVLGLGFINKLRAVDFQWDMRDFYVDFAGNRKLSEYIPDGSKKRSRYHHGVIAQEVQAIIEESGIDFGGLQDHSKSGGDDVLSIGYEEFIAPLIKAVQELSALNNSLEARLVALEAKM